MDVEWIDEGFDGRSSLNTESNGNPTQSKPSLEASAQRRHAALERCKMLISLVLTQDTDGTWQEKDLVMLDLANYLIFSATSIQRKAVAVKDLGLPLDEAMEKIKNLEIPAEYFRGVREI